VGGAWLRAHLRSPNLPPPQQICQKSHLKTVASTLVLTRHSPPTTHDGCRKHKPPPLPQPPWPVVPVLPRHSELVGETYLERIERLAYKDAAAAAARRQVAAEAAYASCTFTPAINPRSAKIGKVGGVWVGVWGGGGGVCPAALVLSCHECSKERGVDAQGRLYFFCFVDCTAAAQPAHHAEGA
jgi:hypothetical protein